MRSKIIWKFFGAFIFLTLIIVFVLNFFVSLRLRENFEQKISEKLQSNAVLVGELLRDDLKEANSAAIQEKAIVLARRFGFRVTVIDPDGKVLGETERKPAEMEDHKDRLEVIKAVKDGFGRSIRLSDTLGYNMQYVAVRVDEAGEILGIVRIALPLSEVQLEIQSIYRVVLVGAIAAVAITLTAAYFVSRGITAPIREMKEIADGIAKGNFSRKVKVRGKDELAQLGRSLNMMADELQVQMENLKRMDQVRTDFVANVSHELKTPLTLIKGYVETLEDKVIRDKAKAQKFLAVIRDHTDRLGNIINDLLSLSELELSKGCIERSTFDLKATIEEVAMGFERAVGDKRHELTINTVGNDFMIEADRSKIEQVFVNLIDNAIKYTPEGGRIEIRIQDQDNTVSVIVEDNGIGVPREDQERVFERFYRVDKARSRQLGGTGLGLGIAKHIVLAHKGTIRIESQVNKGTRVFVTLPRK